MQGPKRTRLRLASRPAGFAMVAAVALLTISSPARADSSNLLPNGSFQGGTTGWTTSKATLSIASDGVDDSFAGRLAATGKTAYQLTAKPRPVLNATAGLVYTANGFVRSDAPGMSLCLYLQEFTSSGSLVLTSNLCTTASSQWSPLPQVTLTAQNDGDKIAFIVKRPPKAVSGESFEVDGLSLVANANASAPSTPANVTASAVSSTEIDVDWDASADPDGIGGYDIFRDGGSAAIGTVAGSQTSFADTAVTPGSTHTYTVDAFDTLGNHSSESAPSSPVTTPGGSSTATGLWHLDELMGTTAYDSSGHGHNGALIGPITLGAPGVVNTAYRYVPKSAIEVPNAADLIPGTADVTISYWLNTSTFPCCNGIDYDMFTKGDQSTQGGQIKLEVQENGQASCMFRGASGERQLQAGPNVVDGTWHHVICQRVDSQIILTVDGSSFSVTKATGAITVTAPIRIGSHFNGGDWYNGLLDEVSYTIGSGGGPPQNQAPFVNAGSDQTVTLPNTASLSGTANDDGLPNPPGALTTTWTMDSGPGTVTFGDASSLATSASFSAPGTYVLRLTADDSLLQSSDTLTVTVSSSSQNLVGNPGFESDTSGWNIGGSDPGVTLTRVSGGHSGGWSGLVANGGTGVASTCKLNDAPNWVKVTSSGTYSLTMWVRADTPGANFTARWREYNGGSLVGTASASVTLSTSWQLVTLSYVPANPGVSTLDFTGWVSNVPVGPCFYADDVSMTLS
jgi:hypothetical protein